MKFRLASFAAVLVLMCSAAHAQDRANWHAVSSTATSITGDIVMSDTKLSIDFASFPIGEIRDLTPQEVQAVFDWQKSANTQNGTLFSVRIDHAQKFTHGNTLCGGQDVRWIAAYIAPGKKKKLDLAMFSGNKPPVFTPEAISNSTDLCGTYSYEHY